MKAYMYVDGFNLYHRAIKGKGKDLKWLDLRTLATRLLPHDSIARIKYFTARITGRHDPDQPRRQQMYLKALGTCPEVETYFGKFRNRKKRRPLITAIPGHPRIQEFHDTEEKGSDVNLASHLVYDACMGCFEVAAVVSNDTDLVEPIRIVTEHVGKVVILLSPCDPHRELATVASAKRQIHKRDIRKSQFPETIEHEGESIIKPDSW